MHTLFYFQEVSQLFDFEAFEVKPVSDSHAAPCQGDAQPMFWAVIGTLREEKAAGIEGRQFPIADLPSERYASLFVELCEQITGA